MPFKEQLTKADKKLQLAKERQEMGEALNRQAQEAAQAKEQRKAEEFTQRMEALEARLMPVFETLKAHLGRGQIFSRIDKPLYERTKLALVMRIEWDKTSDRGWDKYETISLKVLQGESSVKLFAGRITEVEATRSPINTVARLVGAKVKYERTPAYSRQAPQDSRLFVNHPGLPKALEEFIVWAIENKMTTWQSCQSDFD